jgi:hypothetical protein
MSEGTVAGLISWSPLLRHKLLILCIKVRIKQLINHTHFTDMFTRLIQSDGRVLGSGSCIFTQQATCFLSRGKKRNS